jgi:hypothetical protein
MAVPADHGAAQTVDGAAACLSHLAVMRWVRICGQGGATQAFRQGIDGHVVDQVHIDGTYLRPAWPWG